MRMVVATDADQGGGSLSWRGRLMRGGGGGTLLCGVDVHLPPLTGQRAAEIGERELGGWILGLQVLHDLLLEVYSRHAQRNVVLEQLRPVLVQEHTHASKALDATWRIKQRSDPDLKGLRWTLLKNPVSRGPAQQADQDALLANVVGKRTARAWMYREQLREILNRKQIHVVRVMLHQWCANVNRSKVEPMKAVARMIRKHIHGIAAWAKTRRSDGSIKALNGLFQSAKRLARGYRCFKTIHTVFFLIAGKLDFAKINLHVAQHTLFSGELAV